MSERLDAFWSDLGDHLRAVDLLDIGLVAVLLYFVMLWLQTRASRAVVVALALVSAIYALAYWLGLYLVLAVYHELGPTVILISLVLIFQSDIRRAFERLTAWGRHRMAGGDEGSPGVSDTLVDALAGLAHERTGALVILRARENLEQHIRGGIALDGEISVPLLRSIFDPNSPGHDGAALIAGDRLVLFGAHLPLSTNHAALEERGTRHAAALGLAERSDPLVIVVSEERGTLSVAHQGSLEELASPIELKQRVQAFQRSLRPVATPRALSRGVFRNPLLKAASLLLAFGLWWTFAYRVAPVQRTYEVPIELRNPPEGWAVESSPTTADLTLSGREREFRLLDPDQLAFSLELDELIEETDPPGDRQAALSEESLVNAPRGLEVTLIEPGVVTLEAYRWKIVELPVRVRLVNATLPAGLEVERVTAVPDTVRVRVPRESEFTEVPTEWIDLSDVREATTVRPRLNLPENAQYVNPDRAGVEVRIEVGPEEDEEEEVE